ncbi:MAG: glycosyltransferase family 4 protein [Thermodesulfovibrionales bacterium]
MKILFVSLFLPQEKAYHAGGRYVFEVIKNLSKKHDIYLATRLEEGEFPCLESLRPFCKEIYPYPYRTKSRRGFFDIAGLAFNYLGFSRFADGLARRGDFDLVQVEWVEAAIMIRKRKTPMVLDAHDVITKPAERAALKKRGLGRLFGMLRYFTVKTVERLIVKKFDMVFALSEYDRRYLLQIQPGLSTLTVPIPAGLDMTGRTVEREKNTILFLASYKYRRVNVDAALFFYREIFPLIRKSIPAAKFIIAGYGPPEELTSITEKDPGVFVPGFVDDIEECYKTASVFIAPILVGGGIIVKVLDALAAGTPVVTTTYGNEGIGAVPGRDILIADDPEQFEDAVVRVLNDRELAARLSLNGQEFVRQYFTLEASINKIEAAYQELVNNSNWGPGNRDRGTGTGEQGPGNRGSGNKDHEG